MLETTLSKNHQRKFDVDQVRQDFPALAQTVNGYPLIYLDNAATTQKPRSVIDAIRDYYLYDNANVHRGVHALSERATDAYEQARAKVKGFINASDEKECVFVRGATEGINLIAQCYVKPRLQPDDEILITQLEHHANIVPWQMICQQTGAKLRVLPIHNNGELNLDTLENYFTVKTKFFAVGHVSNALGTINPIKPLIDMAHEAKVPVLIDGAQATPHMTIDVQQLDCDFYVLSAHKMYGPTGVGVLYGKAELLDAMSPYQGGGDMISHVTMEGSEYNTLPYKFEAGTPNIAGAIGLGAAIDYLKQFETQSLAAHEHQLTQYTHELLGEIKDLVRIGTAREKIGVFSFLLGDIHPNDIGTLLNQMGIAIRSGHHCTMPLMQHFGIPGTARASLAMYNTPAEVDALVTGLAKVKKLCG